MSGDSASVTVTDESFAQDVLASNLPVLTLILGDLVWPPAAWSHRFSKIAADKADQLTVAKLDVDANPATARDFQVVSIPTLILFKGGSR